MPKRAFCYRGAHFPDEVIVRFNLLEDAFDTVGVILWGDGTQTNRYEDGTNGVREDHAEIAEGEERVYCLEHGCECKWMYFDTPEPERATIAMDFATLSPCKPGGYSTKTFDEIMEPHRVERTRVNYILQIQQDDTWIDWSGEYASEGLLDRHYEDCIRPSYGNGTKFRVIRRTSTDKEIKRL